MEALLYHALSGATRQNPAAVAFWTAVLAGLALVLAYLLLRDAIQALGPVLHTYAQTRRTPRRRAAPAQNTGRPVLRPAGGATARSAAPAAAARAARDLRP